MPRSRAADLSVDPRDETCLQPYGVVLLLRRDFHIVHASTNSSELIGIAPQKLLGRPLSVLLDDKDVEDLRRAVGESLLSVGWRRVVLPGNAKQMKLHAFETGGELLGLDVITPINDLPGTDAQAVERVASWTERLFACTSTSQLFDVVAQIARERTGFDGVYVTQRQDDGSAVILAAEQNIERSFVGTRVPQENLPAGQPQVAGRFVPFFIADVRATPAYLVPEAPGADLQGSALLFPYADYLGGLARIGVGAHVSVPIVIDGQLWGRISAANAAPKRLTAATQAELTLIGAAAGTRLAELLELDAARERVELGRYSSRVVRAMAAASNLVEGLTRDAAALCGVCEADSAIVCIDGENASVGDALPPAVVEQLIDVAAAALQREDISATSVTTFDEQIDPSRAAGFLAARLTTDPRDVVIWVRREEPQTVTWLQQSTEQTDAPIGEGVTPRQEHLRGHSAPWTIAQLQQVEWLRESIGEVIVERYGQIQNLADELIRSNEEYDAFAHAAAHDLKAPLRGVNITAEFLLEDARERLTPGEVEQIETIMRLTGRMRGLLDDLLSYAQIGRAEWNPEPIDVPGAVADVVELLGDRAAGAAISAEPASITSDPTGLRQVLLNLIGNAIKYSDGPATVQIAVETLQSAREHSTPPPSLRTAPPATPVLTVTDYGVGIDPAYHEQIFGLFKQLDPAAEGSGAGLALCRLACRRHGGDIWVSSTPGAGTTFFVAPCGA